MEEVEKDSQKYQELRKILCEHELIVDSAEQAIEKPVDYQEQKQHYSLWQEKNAYPEKPVYCIAQQRRYC
ncbi:hypothetical protein GNF10_10675 [Nostoc sp. UCD121]|uniref:hypothetical protein n=1 Tax=unclassified Nostoc TaxID=2593658 RepID=UPI0016253EF9|nr:MULTISPECIES: hypothetical protein [unclassified Nostoc]MBC1224707.1 hypothetical protein [Nostoc sp. UCD120]MBC1276439.1 hypothetical protein [Nostoc sp. UCD121]